jgi:alpha-L-fucosidase
MKAIIITAKHHDGFCLWPSKYSTHTVRESVWKHGKGDVLKELSAACKEYGLKFGVYLSPWDRNHPDYGTPAYNAIFAKTLEEVHTQYGDVFEQWFDGANGEGPNGKKRVYDWKLFQNTVYKQHPNAVIFSDVGPGSRWQQGR